MTDLPVPASVRRLGADAIEIVWRDGHRGIYPNRYLRDHCPCPVCRRRGGATLPVVNPGGIRATQIAVVGHYAVSIRWSDHHEDGIYRYDTLRRLCPCPDCLRAGASA